MFFLPYNYYVSELTFCSVLCYGLIFLTSPPPLLSSALQHPALVQCLAKCTEVTPYLLVMEFCPLVSIQTLRPGVGRRAYAVCKRD